MITILCSDHKRQTARSFEESLQDSFTVEIDYDNCDICYVISLIQFATKEENNARS